MSEILVNSLKTAAGVDTLTFDSTGDVLLSTGRIGRVAGNTITIDSDGILNATSVNVSSTITLPAGSIDSAAIGTGAVSANKIASGAVEGAMTTQFGRRNLIINGAMQVWQRGTSAANNAYGADRWRGTSVTSHTQSTDVPNDSFNYSLAASGSGGSAGGIGTPIELNVQGKSSPMSSNTNYTLSCWVKGTSGQTLLVRGRYRDSMLGANSQEFLAATQIVTYDGNWQYVIFTFNTGSTVPVASNRCAEILFIMNTADATFYITGVQLEVGTVATPFEHRSFGEELALCQRYYQYVLKTCRLDLHRESGTSSAATLNYATEMRSTPTFLLTRHSTVYGPVNTGAGTSGLEVTDSTNVSTGLYVYTSSIPAQVGVNCTVIAEAEL